MSSAKWQTLDDMAERPQDLPDRPKWAVIISGVLHPFTLPPIAFLLLYIAGIGTDTPTPDRTVAGISVAILFATALPLAAVVYLARRGVVDSIDVSDRTKRAVPLALAILSYAAGFAILSRIGAPELARGLMLCYATNTLVVAVITLWWKISIHAVGTAGPLVAVAAAFGPWVLPAFLLLPIISAARVSLQRHTVGQVVAGSLLGVVLTAGQLALFVAV
ncbi:MAG: phosphatidic acid phosphatase [bacterium]